jgi:hypothetical protein
MLYRPSSFKKSRAFTAVAAAGLFVTASLTATAPASGQQLQATSIASQPNQVDVNTNCRERITAKDVFGDADCEITKGKILDTQGQAIATQNGCIEELVKFKKADPGRFKSMGFGAITRDNACSFASRLPKKAASLP